MHQDFSISLLVAFKSDITSFELTLQAPPTTVDYSVSYVSFQSDRDYFSSFLTSHSLKTSREIISLPFYFSVRKKNSDVISNAKGRF